MDDLTKYEFDKSRRIVRQATADAESVAVGAAIDDMVKYFNSDGAVSQIREKIKDRFGYSVGEVPGTNADGYDRGFQVYKKGKFHAQVDADQFESINTRFGPKVASTLANLFTAHDQSWSLSSDSVDEDTLSEAELLLNKHRDAGGFATAMINADFSACAWETGIVRFSWEGGHVQYQAISPGDVYFLFPETVLDDDYARAPNTGRIDDAMAVVLRVASSGEKSTFVAYFGRSDRYESGRMVTYEAREWKQIPDVGETGVIAEYTINGDVANPLTVVQDSYDGLTETEYPFVILRGGYMPLSTQIAPISYELYELSKEIELGWSRVHKDSLSAGAGVRVLSNTDPMVPPPENLEGAVVLNQGQTLQVLSVGDNVTRARENQEAICQISASGYNVPSRVVVNKGDQQPASGLALLVELQPLKEARRFRIELNKGEVEKVWQIESGLIAFHSDQEIRATAQWDPGNLQAPRTEEERLAALKTRRDMGLSDIVRDTAEYYGVTVDEAKTILDRMKERAVEYPQKTAGLTIPSLPARNPRGFGQ